MSPAQLRAAAHRIRATPGGTLLAELGAPLGPLGGISGLDIPSILDLIAAEREAAIYLADRRIELVWTGPERDGAGTRDTAVVVRELCTLAQHRLLISGYAVFGGKELFAELGARMDGLPALQVQLCVNVSRRADDSRPDETVVLDFARWFRQSQWPGRRLPELFHDPRSLCLEPARRAVLHAKCVIADGPRALVTSANLTEAAHTRNIEAGVLVNDGPMARQLEVQFEDLIGRGALLPVRL